MSYMHYKIFGVTALLFLSIQIPNIFSQSDFITTNSFLFPDTLQLAEYKDQLTMYLAKLPEDIVEEVNSDIYAPFFAYQAKFGLIYGFWLTGTVTTIIITGNNKLGLQWSCL